MTAMLITKRKAIEDQCYNKNFHKNGNIKYRKLIILEDGLRIKVELNLQ
jgi:hypothetical protein